jgi:hypothetical protein
MPVVARPPLQNGVMATNTENGAPNLTAQEKQCVFDVLDVLVAMDINLKAERAKNEKSIL